MLAFVLDALHEDLSRIRSKPYISMDEQKAEENDIECSERWWKNHLTRENSIIVDLFHGQFKSVIRCPDCKRLSQTYDSFMYLQLPIPNESIKMCVKVLDFTAKKRTKSIYSFAGWQEFTINETYTSYDVLKNFEEEGQIAEAVLLNNDKSFKRVVGMTEKILSITSFESEYVVYIFDKPSDTEGYFTIYFTLANIIEEASFTSFFASRKEVKLLDYPFIVTLYKSTDTIKDIFEKIYSLISSLIDTKDETGYKSYYSDKKTNYVAAKPFTEYAKALELNVVNTLPEEVGLFSTKKSKCEFCLEKCNYCRFSVASVGKVNAALPINDLMKKLSPNRSKLYFYVTILESNSSYKRYNSALLAGAESSRPQIKKDSVISLYNCLDSFRAEEKLEKDNTWYCNQCKKHQEATKKMQIYRPPIYLIIQFKRFKIKSTSSIVGLISNKKNDCKVLFESNLNLKPYVVGNFPCNYELISVSNHYGGLSSGHYTATCKNDEKWYEFDDESVSTSNRPCSDSSAYLLFYKLKQDKEN